MFFNENHIFIIMKLLEVGATTVAYKFQWTFLEKKIIVLVADYVYVDRESKP